MQRAIKLRVTVGKDHTVKLPSDFPEGPAEVIVIVAERSTAVGTTARGRGVDQGRYVVPDDFNAQSREIEEAFEG